MLRSWHPTVTITTRLVFKKIDRTNENVRLAEGELSRNDFGLEEDWIAVERESLHWIRDGMKKERESLQRVRDAMEREVHEAVEAPRQNYEEW